jgi:CHAT domain-containing protein
MWRQAMPDDVRREFWRLRDKNLLSSLTTASDVEYVPWELVYPVDEQHDKGFLVQQLPVLRRVPKQQPATSLAIRSAAYVVPPGSPSDALAEVEDIRKRLGDQILDCGVVQRRDQLDTLLDETPPNVLHFACHNAFTDTAGSTLSMGYDTFDPEDLNRAAGKRSMRGQVPLVFFNACRSAGEIAGLTNPIGWARQFMAAGAGAFIGSLWLVRSDLARNFADAFYTSFVSERRPLGEAALQARRASMSDTGDPTWLAYTVYGHHGARLAAEGNDAATTAQ